MNDEVKTDLVNMLEIDQNLIKSFSNNEIDRKTWINQVKKNTKNY